MNPSRHFTEGRRWGNGFFRLQNPCEPLGEHTWARRDDPRPPALQRPGKNSHRRGTGVFQECMKLSG